MLLAIILSTVKIVPLSSNLQRNYLLKKSVYPIDSAVNDSTFLKDHGTVYKCTQKQCGQSSFESPMLTSNVVAFLLLIKNFL